MRRVRPCPCGSGLAYAACCGPLHTREREAATAEQLMRSRYAAYALGEVDHVFRTWHPRTRPADVTHDPTTAWIGLAVLDTHAGGPDDDTGVVEFRASYDGPDGPGVLHETSRFERRRGRWVYVEAVG